MRKLWLVYVAVAMANVTSAQESPKPSGQFFGPLVSGIWTKKTPNINAPKLFVGVPPFAFSAEVLPQPPGSRCSVPLLEMKVPEDTDFTILQMRPPRENLDRMPRAKVPAPPCDLSSRR